ncbi:DUF29 domain-containing protein (plasmid) [Methylocaldum sp. MU1018]|jgi:hypothetical protein
MAGIAYETDVAAWAWEQAQWLRERRFDALDIEHLADEIEDVAKSEQRELERRLAILLAHLLRWLHQPERRTKSWRLAMSAQRKAVAYPVKESPSLRHLFDDPEWLDGVWADAIIAVLAEVELDNLPEVCPWTITDILDPDWLPNEG